MDDLDVMDDMGGLPMIPTLIRRLAGMFGSAPFTTAQARAALVAGLDEPMQASVLGALLREAVGMHITDGRRSFRLSHAGTVHKRTRRWVFVPITEPSPTDPDEDLL